jgi:D-alanine-D-alanine ligase-like ATP-grasp enzyme
MQEINTKKICSACGTSPINHHLLLTLSILEETLGRIGDKLFSFASKGRWQKMASLVEKGLYLFFYTFHIVRFDTNIEKANTGRSKLIWEEAQKRSTKMEQVVIFGKHIEFYRAKIDKKGQGKMYYFPSLPIPPWLPQEGYKWLDDKFILSQKLLNSNVAAPIAEKIYTWSSTQKAFRKMQKPVILKPKNGSRGRHTTTNIKTEEELKKAFALTRQIAVGMVIQEHLFGKVCRATVINGKLVGFFVAELPQVVGHNSKSIKELVEDQNKNHNERVSPIVINDDLINFIKREGYTLGSKPKDGSVVNLSAKTGRMYGGRTKEMLPDVHPKMHEIFKKAGGIVNAPVVGFDLIIEDPTADPDAQKWGIIECNSLPYIDLHYFALEGTPINLAKNVWDLWE